ncbi:MAG TPA: tryptophan--tRNA ligase [Clostridia bacterium]|nr:tryptophan--tRNA ligase [Clostridia bacterium]
MNEKKRILTGDRPTSRLHIGHYVGSLENRVKLQNAYEQFIIIADVQALTTHFEHPEILKKNVYDLCIDYLSVGIDPDKSHIFVQSIVPQIAELTVFYSMFVMVNTLKHNPTIKTEAAQYGFTDLSYGFLGYPVSQAADITFCGADLVPVGEDQLPVVEVTRKIVRRFNSLYKPVLKEPETMLGTCPRLIGLDGNAKMSKSMGNAIFLSDDFDTIHSKVKTAVTDPGRIKLNDKGNPDICIVNEYHRIFNPDQHQNICSMCRNASIGCTACKKELSGVLDALLKPVREKRKALEEKPEYIRDILMTGSKKAKEEGLKTLEEVKEAMNINYFQ